MLKKMLRLICIFILLSYCSTVILAINTHQFHFAGGNVAYGQAPQLVHVVGFWYIHERNPHFQELFNQGYEQDDLRGTLYYCTVNVAEKLTLISPTAEKNKIKKANMLLSQSRVQGTDIEPFIDVTGCEQLPLTDFYLKPRNTEKTGRLVKRFDLTHNFTHYGPILFIDPWGVAAFHLRAKQSESHKLQYCENDDASFPVIFNKRPICPRPALKSTVVENGKLTIYKPNIESVRKIAYHCYVETVYVWTKQNFVGQNSDNQPPTKKVAPVTATLCSKWINTGKCDVDGVSIYNIDEDFNSTMTEVSESRWATTNEVEYKYDWMQEHEYTIANCIVDVGYIQTTPPFSSLLTPWGYVPSDYLYRNNFTRVGGEVIVWSAFETEDICNYVPMSSIDVKRITYNSKDFLEQDPHPGAEEMYHFVSDADKSVYTSDNTQVTDVEAFNCVTREENQILYTINNGMVISWQNGSSINDDEDLEESMSQREYHTHYAYNELTKTIGGNCINLKGRNCSERELNDTIFSTTLGGSDGGENDTVVKTLCTRAGCTQSYVSSNIRTVPNVTSNENYTNYLEKTFTLPNLTASDTSPLFAIVAYLRFKFEQYQNEEVIRRAQAWCENQQHLYDIQLMLARMSPSTVISSYLNRPASARFIGNGVYSTHYCQTVNDFIVVDNLFVNNTDVAPKMNGKRYVDIYKAAGVPVHKKLCFTMPIIVFRDSMSVDEYRVGQLHKDQAISTVNMPFLEECQFDRYFYHTIGSHVYVFENYKQLSITSLDDLFDHAKRIRDNTQHLKRLEHHETTRRKNIEPLLENTQFIDIYTKYEPKLTKPVVIGFKNTELYDYRERRRIISSFEDVIAYQSAARFDNRVFYSRIFGQKQVSHGLIDFEEIVDGVTDGFKIITDGISDTVNYVIDAGGDTLENVVDRAGGILGEVADFFSGGFMKIIIIVAAIAVFALFVYFFMKNHLLADDGDDKLPPQTYPAYPPYQTYSVVPAQIGTEIRRRPDTSEKFISEF